MSSMSKIRRAKLKGTIKPLKCKECRKLAETHPDNKQLCADCRWAHYLGTHCGGRGLDDA